MKMNRTSAAAAVIAAGLVASLGALAPVTVSADELTVATPAATSQSADAEDPAAVVADDADADAVPGDDAAVSAVALSDESTAAPEAKAPVATSVAEFNGTQYGTFDEALAAAKDTDNATIKLLDNAETAGLDLSKNLTIDGNDYALKFTDKGIALRGKALTFKKVNVTMTDIGSTPAVVDNGWTWMTVCAGKGASLTLDGATLTMDGTRAGSVHGIYFCGNNKLNLKNASNLTIKNYKQDALEWNGGIGYIINIENGSTYTSDHCRSGIVGTFDITVDNSKVNVVNSTGNGSNGSHFNIKNGSVVDFSSNGSHGLSAGNLTIDDSTVTANNNGLNGIIFTGKGTFTKAKVSVTGTVGKYSKYADDGGLHLFKEYASLDVDADSTVSITNNSATGLFLDPGAEATFAKGAKLTIVGNDASAANASTKKEVAQYGGGVVVRDRANLTLLNSAVIDNNNAALAGDDLYVEKGGAISFGATHNNVLSDFEGCGHAIDGWYVDAKDSRWSAHGEGKYVKAAQPGTYEAKEAPVAFKAAHGLLNVVYQYVGDAPESAVLPDADADLEVGSPYTAQAQNPVDGWTFAGWYTDEACTTQWVDGTLLTGSMTLYGKWTKNPETPATPAETQKPTTNKPAKKQVKKSIPKTGDETSSALPFALFGGAAAVIGLGVKSRRHE